MNRDDLYSEEDSKVKVIIPFLESKGYEKRNMRFEQPISVKQGRETKTIFCDIVLYENSDPIIAIDAKNPREALTEEDKEQVISYARLLPSIAPIAVVSNGKAWEVYNVISKELISSIPERTELLKKYKSLLITSKNLIELRDEAEKVVFGIDDVKELSQILGRCHDIIRNTKGYDPTKAFDEISKILFCKMYEEKRVALALKNGNKDVKNRFTTKQIEDERKNGVEIIHTIYNETVTHYKDVFDDEDEKNLSKINLTSQGIDKIVGLLENHSLTQTNMDVKGVAFETFLSRTYRGGGLGQYFTPREIVDFMIDLVNPEIDELIIDPACGSGGFLIKSYEKISRKIAMAELSKERKEEERKKLAQKKLFGFDWESRAARTCKMNMIIHGDGHNGIFRCNALDLEETREKTSKLLSKLGQNLIDNHDKEIFSDGVKEGIFNVAVTNPPFGAKDEGEYIKDYELGAKTKVRLSQKREVLFIERCIRFLKPGGRLAIIVPEGILTNQSDREIRDYIRRECIIKASIRLPQDAFKMSEGASYTSILFVTKKENKDQQQGDIFMARAENIGISPSGKQIPENDLPMILEEYRKFERGDWDGIFVG